jgi:hypothetical protein
MTAAKSRRLWLLQVGKSELTRVTCGLMSGECVTLQMHSTWQSCYGFAGLPCMHFASVYSYLAYVVLFKQL